MLGAGTCFSRDTRAFFAGGGLGILGESSEEAAALAERRGLARVLVNSGDILGMHGMDESACNIDMWDWSGEISEGTDLPTRFRLLAISES